MSNLRDRAYGQQAQSEGKELVAARATFATGLDRMTDQFAAAMPSGIEAKQLARDAITLVQLQPKLLQLKDQRSLYGALMTCASLGLRPIPQLGLAYVVPFKGRAQFVCGYKGLAQLAHRSGQLRGITNRIVRRGDLYVVAGGDAEEIIHKPKQHTERPDDRAELDPVAYYAIVRDQHQGRYPHAMWRWEVEDHRDQFALQREWNPETRRNDGAVKGPWVDHFDAMALKTVLKFALRVAPQSVEMQRAIIADESVRVELDPVAPIESQIIPADEIPDGDDVVDAEFDDDEIERQVRAADPT